MTGKFIRHYYPIGVWTESTSRECSAHLFIHWTILRLQHRYVKKQTMHFNFLQYVLLSHNICNKLNYALHSCYTLIQARPVIHVMNPKAKELQKVA